MAKNQEIIELSENSKSWPFIEAHRISINLYGPLILLMCSSKNCKHGAFTGTVRSGESVDLILRNLQIDPFQGLYDTTLGSVGFSNVFKFYGKGAHRLFFDLSFSCLCPFRFIPAQRKSGRRAPVFYIKLTNRKSVFSLSLRRRRDSRRGWKERTKEDR